MLWRWFLSFFPERAIFLLYKYKSNYIKFLKIKGPKGGLPKPAVPKIIDNGWDSIQLNLSTTKLANYSGFFFLVEVEPLRSHSQTNVNVFTIFPYIEKYHLVSLHANVTMMTRHYPSI